MIRRQAQQLKRVTIGGLLLLCLGCAAEPEAVQRVDVEREVRIGLQGEPTSLDPHLQDELYARTVLANVYESLVTFDANLRLRPALAANWINPDDYTWIFELRPGATFHDGRPVTVDDIVASIERAKNHPSSRVSGYLVAVDSVRAVDAAHIEIRTIRPYPILLNKLSFVAIVPADAPERIERPIGSGPYRLQAINLPGRYRLTAVDFAPGRVAAADFLVLPAAERRLDLLGQGEIDLAMAPGGMRESGDPAVRITSLASLSVTYLQLPVDRPPFDDSRVRQAFDLAVDRRQLVLDLHGGAAEPAGQLVSPQVFGYVPDLEPSARDLPRARQLLREAGFADGLEFVLDVREGREVGTLLAQLEEAGLRGTLRVSPWPELYPRLARGEVEVYLGAWQCSSGDASDLFDHKLHSYEPGLGYGDSNGYHNPELDAQIEASGEIFTMAERRRALEDVMRRAMADLPLVPLIVPYDAWAVRSGIDWRPRLGGLILVSEIRRQVRGHA